MNATIFLYSLISLNDLFSPLPGECPVLVDHKYYNLCPLVGKPPINMTINSMNVTFNLGQEQLWSCNASQLVWGTLTDPQGDCFDFTQANANYATAPSDDESDGIQVILTSNPVNGQVMNFVMNLYCDEEGEGDTGLQLQVDGITINGTNTYITTHTSSYYGCAVASSNQVMDFLLANKYVFAPILMGIGILNCFFGLKYSNIVINITLVEAVVFVISLLIEETIEFSGPQLVLTIVITALIAADFILTYRVKKFTKIGFIILGTAFGAVNGVIFYDTMFSPILRSNAGDAIFYIMVSICSVAAAVIAAWVQQDGFITFTAFIGSYLIIRPLSTLLGGYPSEIAVASGLEDFNKITYVYLIFMLLIAYLGSRFQTKRYKELLKSKKPKDEMITFSEYMHFL